MSKKDSNRRNSKMAAAPSKDYEVGFGKPPKHTQFKPGQSGNKNGRPKGSRNVKTDVQETANRLVTINEGGKKKKVSTRHAALLRLRDMAFKSDNYRILIAYIELVEKHEDHGTGLEQPFTPMTLEQERVLQEFLDRQKRGDNPPEEEDRDDDAA